MTASRCWRVPGVVALACVVSLNLGGCTADNAEEPSRGSSSASPTSNAPGLPPELPSWSPMDQASPADFTPDGIDDDVDLESAETAARAGQDRASAEQFALYAIAVLQDARIEADPDEVLGSLLSDRASDDVREFLLNDMETQGVNGAERHLDGSLEQWIRSDVTGDAGAPDGVAVEVAANLTAERYDFHTWYRYRADVRWIDGRWQLVGFNASDLGPYTSANVTPAEQEQYLEGDHWRRVPPRQ